MKDCEQNRKELAKESEIMQNQHVALHGIAKIPIIKAIHYEKRNDILMKMHICKKIPHKMKECNIYIKSMPLYNNDIEFRKEFKNVKNTRRRPK